MKVKIRGGIRDVLSFLINAKKRKAVFRKAPAVPMKPGKINELSRNLHPAMQDLIIESVTDEGGGVYTYRLKGSGRTPAYFIPGQYISIGFRIGESTLHRAFSIASDPADALTKGFYDITVKTRETGGFTDSYIRENWTRGVPVKTSGPAGTFTYQRLRDSRALVCIAGGSGITPYKSMIPSLLQNNPVVKILLLQGADKKDELIFNSYWKELKTENPDRFSYIPVCAKPDSDWNGCTGFITADLISKEVKNSLKSELQDCSFFICGPRGLHDFIDRELSGLEIPGKRIRREEYAVNSRDSDDEAACFYSIRVRQGKKEAVIRAYSTETVLTAMERAGLNPPSLCRSGECGWCRSRLVSGKLTQPERPTGLRAADKKFSYFHPCSVFPLGDLEIEVPENPIKL